MAYYIYIACFALNSMNMDSEYKTICSWSIHSKKSLICCNVVEIEQCCTVHIVQGCQQHKKTLLHLIAATIYNVDGTTLFNPVT